MTRNDIFFKILFAIEIALLPLVMASYILMPTWTVGLFIAGVLVTKIWLELFKNKDDKVHAILITIANILTVSSLVIFFAVYSYVNVILCVFVVIFSVAMNVLKLVLREKTLPDMVQAVDTCYMLFECLLLIGLAFVMFYELVTNIALFALLLTAIVSVAYKVVYMCKHYDVINKLKSMFRRK